MVSARIASAAFTEEDVCAAPMPAESGNRKKGRTMANEDMIGSSVEGSSARNKGAHSEESWHTAEDLKSAASAVAKDYAEKGSAVLDEAKERVRTLREDGADYVRKNPTKAVFAALGVGFVLGLIYKH
jgi:ElaB/YqjD/DUF883 family membrane-anchored ribosome-binding protein